MKRKKTRPALADPDDVRALQESLRRLPGAGGYQAAEAARAVYDDFSELHWRFPQDDEARRAFSEAHERYQDNVHNAYPPGFAQSLSRLRAGDPSGLEDIVAFLEADPLFYGTGYLKEDLSRPLRDLEIPGNYVSRLQAVVLNVVERRDGREFRAYCRLASRVDAPRLREQLTRRLTHDDPATRRRARWVLEALAQKDRMGKRA